MTRRDFLEKLGWGAIVLAAGGFMAGLARFFEPKLITPARGPVEVGRPEDFAIGSLTFADKARAYVGHDESGFYAMGAVCTHLGCTPHLAEQGEGFICPCHGSQFSRDGHVVTGPATKPIERAWVGRGANGQLFVDRSRVVDASYRLAV